MIRIASRWLAVVLTLGCLPCVRPVSAHEIRPAFLQIEETAPQTYHVLWKVPRIGGSALDIEPVFDEGFTLETVGGETVLDGFVVYQYRLTGTRGLPGTHLAIRNLPQTTIDVLVTLTLRDGQEHSVLLGPASSTVTIPTAPDRWHVVTTYGRLGIEHILFGFDHLLFVLALIILTRGARRIVKTITAFTIAHSITLSLAALGVVHVPGPPVEATIALSIMFLATEILRGLDGRETLAGRKPWLVAFTFGLLHGLGFAGALSKIGLPQTAIPLALACFNVGVELGQLAFVAVMLVLLRALRTKRDWPVGAYRLAPYAIGSLSAFWLIERVLASVA